MTGRILASVFQKARKPCEPEVPCLATLIAAARGSLPNSRAVATWSVRVSQSRMIFPLPWGSGREAGKRQLRLCIERQINVRSTRAAKAKVAIVAMTKIVFTMAG